MTDAPIAMLDALGAEFARVARAPEQAPRRSPFRPLLATPPRLAIAAILAALVLLGGAYALPTTRAAIEDLTSSFAGWAGGDDRQAPGRALRPGDNAPDWVRERGGGRLIAENAGVGLFVTRTQNEAGVSLDFWLGEGIGIGDSVEGWRERFDDHAIVVLGPSLFGPQDPMDDRGRLPLFGVTARAVTRLELRYVSGPPLLATGVNGGFVLLVDAWRPLRALIAYDAAGRVLERADVTDLDFRYYCAEEPGCPTP